MRDRDVTRLDDAAGEACSHRGGRARYFLASGLIGVVVLVVGYRDGQPSGDKGGDIQGLKGGGGGQGGASPVASQLDGAGGLLRMDRCKDLAGPGGKYDALRCRFSSL